MVDGHADVSQNLGHDSDVLDLRDVGEAAALAGQGRGGHQLQGGVLCTADCDGTLEAAASLDSEDFASHGFRFELPVEGADAGHPLLAGRQVAARGGRTPGRLVFAARRSSGDSLGHTDADQCSLQRRPSGGEVDGLDETALDDVLGLASGSFGPLQVYLRGHVRGLGQHNDTIRPNLQEPAEDGEGLFVARRLEAQHALAE